MSSPFEQPFLYNPGCCLGQNSDNSSTFNWWRQHVREGDFRTEDKRQKDEVDALLSEAIGNLTFEEREKQQEILHGVDDDLSEEAHVVEMALAELDYTLSRIKHFTLYETAEQMNPNYVHARDFRIMFLRSKRYDVQAAAKQMLKFFETKHNLFGTEKLAKEITIEDLDEDDLDSLRAGWLQFSGKDKPGRVVVNTFLGLRYYRTLKNELRTKFYMLMELLKDEGVQLQGVIGLNFAIDQLRDNKNGAGYMEHTLLSNAIPVHMAAIHVCCNDVSQYIITKMAISPLPQKVRSRFKVHFGSSLECQYILSTYGISHDNLPIIPGTSKVDMTRHMDWCRSHSAISSSSSGNYFSPDAPTPNDVLYIGGNRSKNGGNDLLRNLVAEWSNTYDSATTNDIKKRVVNEIIDTIHRTGGRFLIQSDIIDSAWVEVPKEEVRVKITQAFRNRRRNGRGRGKKQI